MGIFDRFKTVVKSNINDLISKAENPEKMLNQLVFDMNSQLVEAKKQVAAAIADEKRLERQLLENKAKAEDWERKAMLAVKAGKDDLAKEALLRKQEYESYTQGFQGEWEKQRQAVEQLKGTLRQLQMKIEEATRKKNLLVARAKRAEAQKRIQNTLGQLSDTSAFSTFDRMAAKVDQLEAEADAMGEIADMTGQDTSLENQFKQLESSGASADLLLEELKTKMAKLEDKTSQTQQEQTP
jgi:phage shock protein A